MPVIHVLPAVPRQQARNSDDGINDDIAPTQTDAQRFIGLASEVDYAAPLQLNGNR
jgi:hypothetical protein